MADQPRPKLNTVTSPPSKGKGGANREHMRGGGFPGPGALHPPKSDGRDAEGDGPRGFDVTRTRKSGSHDPRATHK